MSGFLPDFRANRTVFLLVLLAELFAMILALSETNRLNDFWNRLALSSLFVQWVALGSAAVLALLQRLLSQLHTSAAALMVLGITQSITLLCTVTGWRWLNTDGLDWPPPGLAARNLAISGIITLIALRYFYMRHQWQHHVEAEAHARLRALQARIHPHFLFNTLNTIAGLIPGAPDKAEQAVLDLADLLRSALAERTTITLAEELNLTRRYLAIEQLRMGERLHIDWQLDDPLPLDTPLPPLLLQPLVENAIRHGIQPRPDGGTLTLRITRQPRTLDISISNPRPASAAPTGHHLAQDNIRQRLALAYPLAAPLSISASADRYQVQFSLPLDSAVH
jgi:two-component system sensor histidine kinase AlgZ